MVNASNNDDANFARDQSWRFIVQCPYNLSVHDASDTCMSISASTRFFDSGASKHITSYRVYSLLLLIRQRGVP